MVLRKPMSFSDPQNGLVDWSRPPSDAGTSAHDQLPSNPSSSPAPPATAAEPVSLDNHNMAAPGLVYDHNHNSWMNQSNQSPSYAKVVAQPPHVSTTPPFVPSQNQQQTPPSDNYTSQDHAMPPYQANLDGTPSRTPTQFRSNNPFIQAKRQRESLSKQSTGTEEYLVNQPLGGVSGQDNERDTNIYPPPADHGINDVFAPGNGPLHEGINSPSLQNGSFPSTRFPYQGENAGHSTQFNLPTPFRSEADGPWYSLGSSTPEANTANRAFDGVHPTATSYENSAKGKSPSRSLDLLELEDALPSSHGSTQSHTDRDTTNVYSQRPEEPPSLDGAAGSSILKHEEPSLLDTSPSQNIDASPYPSRAIDTSKDREMYDIREVNWTDGTTKLRRSPILVQNKNGPCPLLALVNGLVLRAKPGAQPPIITALQSRKQISLQDLREALVDELTSYPGQIPDLEVLTSFLTMLHTGMNVNPKLVPVTTPWDLPGTFQETNDTRLYSSFNLPLVHGWLASPTSPAYKSLSRVADNHEDIQLLHFQKEDMESRVFGGGTLSPQDEQTMADIDTIQHFVNVENPTQLSEFGLEHLGLSLDSGSISILFRNDHFATLFKHPLSDQLFTLVTDAGYSSHAEIVWESLVDVSGSKAEFFSGDFRPVSHTTAAKSQSQKDRQSVGGASGGAAATAASSANHSEQMDADYAYALSLQYEYEEDQRSSAGGGRGGRGGRAASNPPRTSWQHDGTTDRRSSARGSVSSHRHSTSSTGRQSQQVRSLVPPRTHSNHDETENADAPPPTYEQAALSPAYIPEEGHPQHDRSPSIAGPRSSSYGFNNVPTNSSSNISSSPVRRPIASQLPPRPRERRSDKDCVVM